MCSRKCMFSEVHDRMLKNAKKKKGQQECQPSFNEKREFQGLQSL